MKIIRSGKNKNPKEVAIDCMGCDCKFSASASEGKFVSDQRDGNCYKIKCPECKHENWIAADLFH